jgi:hypothetical protein
MLDQSTKNSRVQEGCSPVKQLLPTPPAPRTTTCNSRLQEKLELALCTVKADRQCRLNEALRLCERGRGQVELKSVKRTKVGIVDPLFQFDEDPRPLLTPDCVVFAVGNRCDNLVCGIEVCCEAMNAGLNKILGSESWELWSIIQRFRNHL